MRFVLLFAALLSTASALDLLRPPGHRPLENGAHAITGARLVISPGKELENATLLIRDGRISAVGTGLAIPPDARVHDLKDCTIYAGFIDAHVSMAKSTVRKTNGAQDNTPPVSALNDLTAGAGSGFLGTSSAADSRNVVSPQYRVAQDYSPDAKLLESLRAEGFTNANIVPGSGVLRGVSTVVSLGSTDPDFAILRADTFHHIAIETPKGSEDGPVPYPGSLMGTIALIRQTLLDAQFQAADHAHFEKNSTQRPRPAYDAGLAALLPALQKRAQVVFEPASPLMVDRAQRLATEFGLETILLATGQEWRRPDLLQEARAPFLKRGQGGAEAGVGADHGGWGRKGGERWRTYHLGSGRGMMISCPRSHTGIIARESALLQEGATTVVGHRSGSKPTSAPGKKAFHLV